MTPLTKEEFREVLTETVGEIVGKSHQTVAKAQSDNLAEIKKIGQKSKTELPLGVFVTVGTIIAAILGSYFTTINTQNAKAFETKEELKRELGNESLIRLESDTVLSGKFEQIDAKLDAIIEGLNIKYSLPKEVVKKQ